MLTTRRTSIAIALLLLAMMAGCRGCRGPIEHPIPQTTPLLSDGLIAPSRAIDWTKMGAAIPPTRTVVCKALAAGATASDAMAALNSCKDSNQIVTLPAGTFAWNSTLFGGGAATPSGVTLRGAGRDKTIIKFTATSNNCNGMGPAAVCIYNGDSGSLRYSANQQPVTSGASPGSQQITLAAVPNLKIGSLITLWQNDDPLTDTGKDWYCGTPPSGSTGYCTWQGSSSALASNKTLGQTVTVTGCGTGTKRGDACTSTTVSFTPGLYSPHWTESYSPVATYSSTLPVYGFGLEDLKIDVTSLGGMAAITEMMWAENSWVKNVASINNASVGGAAKNHYFIGSSKSITVRDGYMFGANGASSGYGIDFAWGTSDFLAENNISQHIPTGYITETVSGGVFGYNFATDNYYSGNWQQCDVYHHAASDVYVLVEGHDGICAVNDAIHGTSFGWSYIRNRFRGLDPATQCPPGQSGCGTAAKTLAVASFQFQAYARYNNVLMNVLGTPGKITSYKNVATKAATDSNGNLTGCQAPPWFVNYSFGYSNGNQLAFTAASSGGCFSNGFNLQNDPLTSSTAALWGNWDNVTNAVRTDADETASNAAAFPGLPSPSTNYSNYKSLYLTAKPYWWPAAIPWPATGPDVTGGDPSLGGHYYPNPAAACYHAQGGKDDGSSGPLNFDNAACGGGSGPTPPPGPTATWSWSAPAPVNGVTAASYNLYQSAGSCPATIDISTMTQVKQGVTGTTFTQDPGPTGDTCNVVTAVSSAGVEGQPSNRVSVIVSPPTPTAPGPPTNLTVTYNSASRTRKRRV